MAKRTILIAVVAFLAFSSFSLAAGWFSFYYSFGVGANQGYLPPSYGNWDTSQFNNGNTNLPTSNIFVTDNPLDDSCAATYDITTPALVNLFDAGFSYNHIDGNSIDAWLASPGKTLLYSTFQCIGPYSASGGTYDSNDDVIAIDNGGNEHLIAHAEALTTAPPYTPPSLGTPIPGGNTFGVTDIINLGGYNGYTRGYMALADFDVTSVAPDPNQRIYYTASNYVVGQFVGGVMHRPNVVWNGGVGNRGSGYNYTLLAGDVVTAENLNSQDYAPSFGIFVNAWRIAGTMLGDKFWLSGLVWNNYGGYVSTSTANGAAEAAGHLAIKDFVDYIMAITAVKVQDLNGNGVFDAGDKIMFTLAPDDTSSSITMSDWKNIGTYVNASTLAGQFFAGGLGQAIYIYDGNTVTTYMDKNTSQFFGQTQTTGAATIWGGAYGQYSISGFDLTTFVPEPSTMILLIGSGLALGAGILRRRLR